MPILLTVLVLAPIIGSFLGVLIRRLPADEDVVFVRSRCDSCHMPLAARDLVPIASFIASRGACRHCGAAIPREALAIELAAMAVALWAATVDSPPLLWLDCTLGWTLLALAWIDWQHFRLPDVLTLPLVLAGLAATDALDPDALTDHAAAAAIGYLAFRLIAWIYRLCGSREGLGQGDAKLLAAGGAWLGLTLLPWVLVVSALLGIAVALAGSRHGTRLSATSTVPYGAALALAIWLLWLYAGTDWTL